MVLAWTRRDLWRGQARGWRTHTQTDTHTDRQTQATTIPEGQNWPRVTKPYYQKVINLPYGWQVLTELYTPHVIYNNQDKSVKHDDDIEWKHLPRYWPFVKGIHRWPVISPHKGQWRGALMIFFICAWTNGLANNRNADDLRRHRAHYGICVKWSNICEAGGMIQTGNRLMSDNPYLDRWSYFFLYKRKDPLIYNQSDQCEGSYVIIRHYRHQTRCVIFSEKQGPDRLSPSSIFPDVSYIRV